MKINMKVITMLIEKENERCLFQNPEWMFCGVAHPEELEPIANVIELDGKPLFFVCSLYEESNSVKIGTAFRTQLEGESRPFYRWVPAPLQVQDETGAYEEKDLEDVCFWMPMLFPAPPKGDLNHNDSRPWIMVREEAIKKNMALFISA